MIPSQVLDEATRMTFVAQEVAICEITTLDALYARCEGVATEEQVREALDVFLDMGHLAKHGDGRVEWIGQPHPENMSLFHEAISAAFTGAGGLAMFITRAQKVNASPLELITYNMLMCLVLWNVRHFKELAEERLARIVECPPAYRSTLHEMLGVLVQLNMLSLDADGIYRIGSKFTHKQ